jgi:hypothetical protein
MMPQRRPHNVTTALHRRRNHRRNAAVLAPTENRHYLPAWLGRGWAVRRCRPRFLRLTFEFWQRAAARAACVASGEARGEPGASGCSRQVVAGEAACKDGRVDGENRRDFRAFRRRARPCRQVPGPILPFRGPRAFARAGVALDRAARAEGQVNALREQLVQVTAALQDRTASTGKRRA